MNETGDYNLADQPVPIPIQVFLWRQVSPFIRPKLGKLHEASCMFCQHAPPGHHELKEACKTFEKVLVQNIQFGLKPDLTEAIKSIPRWRLIQSALPHVMHCTASLLFNKLKDGSTQNLGAVETKLLYTLHWIILDAAEECADADCEKGIFHSSVFYYLFPIPTITLFVYLFAPLAHHMKESDFQNFRLENGLKIWQGLWEFRHPDAPCFTTHCKPKPKYISGKHKNKPQFGDVFLGRKPSGSECPLMSEGPSKQSISSVLDSQLPVSSPGSVTVTATITKISDDDGSWVSSPKDTVFPETIPEESSSTEDEHVVIFRLPSLCESDGFIRDPSIYTVETSLFQLSMKKNGSNKQVKSDSSGKGPSVQKTSSSTDKESIESKDPSIKKTLSGCPSNDASAATLLDVAVLRCLFISHWQEEGVYWALHYMYNRLRDISEETANQQQPRRRSNSLPIPKTELSLFQSNEKKQEAKDFIEVPEVKDVSPKTVLYDPDSPFHQPKASHEHVRRASEKSKKGKTKMSDLKAFVETKLLSKSDKALEKIGMEEPKPLGNQAVGSRRMLDDYHHSLDTGEDQLARRNSAKFKMFEPLKTNLVKGKSMPSLSCLIDELTAGGYLGEIHWEKRRPSRLDHPQHMANPIITVTEHTPTPSPDYLRRQGSIDSQLESLSGGRGSHWHERKPSLTRSQTDSNITYAGEETPEAVGSFCYITKDGNIDIQVVLKAVHYAVMRDHHCCTLRVLEVILNLVELLMDTGVLKQCLRDEALAEQASTPLRDNSSAKAGSESEAPVFVAPTDVTEKQKKVTPHRLIMHVIVRVLKHLGCPHGCSEGQRGPAAEFLRTQCQNILIKLNRASSKQFKSFLRDYVRHHRLQEVLEFFHAYVGFCVDPTSLLSPLNQKRGSSKSPDTVSQGGYATNFGTGLGGAGVKGIENTVISHVFKLLVTRFVNASKEIRSPENLGFYCEIRQLMTYVKEAHGSTFRRVALSALIDTADRPNKKESNIQTTRVIRHVLPSDIEAEEVITEPPSSGEDSRGNRKLLFKKRSTSSTCASLHENEGEEVKTSQSPLGNIRKKHHVLTPRHSERTLGIAEPSTSKQMRSKTKIGDIVNWFRKSDPTHERFSELTTSESDLTTFARKPSQFYPTKLPIKSRASHMSHTIQKAKRRVEDRLSRLRKLKKGKKKDGSTEEPSAGHFSKRNSFDLGEPTRESEFVVLKQRKLISTASVYNGMTRLSFLLETCPPGSVPDSHLLASVLDLPHSSVTAKAAFLLECAFFVHCCNKGQWPSWMKLNFQMFRPSGPLPQRGTNTGIRRTHIMQKAAGKMFHQWAEALGSRLEEMINEDRQLEVDITSIMLDEAKQRELLLHDEEEDYLDEASIHTYGASCPVPLRLIACILLLEITTFLRETYQTLPKAHRMTGKEKPPPWEKLYSREANRRWSMALSSMGHSQASAQSLQSIAGDRESGQTERKISFVLHEPDNESEGSSNTTLTLQGEDGRRLAQHRPYLLRRGTACPTGGSFKRRSLKLRRGTKEGKDMEVDWKIPETVKRTDSIQSKRKVSSISDRSDTSEPGIPGEASGEESPGVLSDDQPPESPSDSNDTDDTTKNMPWLKVMIMMSNSFYFFCTHQNFCHPYCHRRVMRGCSRLIKSVRKVYGEEFGFLEENSEVDSETKKKSKKEKNQNRKVSDQTSSQVSPIRRKDSVGKKDRIDRNIDASNLNRLASKDSSRDIADSDTDKDTTKKSKEAKPKDSPPILRYIKTQVKDSFHSPLAVLLKGAVLLSEEHFLEVMPVAWELLLEHNQEVAAAAASLFILAAVKAPQHVCDIMQNGLANSDATVRINSILRFQVLWKLRFQVWPRMEEGAHLFFKVTPPGIEFTLPSPKIGIESVDVVDSPWKLAVKTKVEEVTLNQERHRSLVTATKTRKKQQTELIKMALQAEDDKKREARENFLITSVPITMQAAHEPNLHHTSEEHDEGDDEQTDGQQRNTGHHLQSAHSLFPSCLCSAAIQIISLLDDAAVSADGSAVYEVAYRVIWICLVEDSSLFLRYILERLTREKQDQMFKILRHLIRFIPKLPHQAAFALYNYIIGYVMFYVRTPHEDGLKLIGAALSLLWMVVHSVHGIMFKDLKQILRKEQCDASILLTANVPSAKKIIVHGPQDPDAGVIPSQFPVQEDTQFLQILKESLGFFDIDEQKHKEYFLVDYKTHQIRNPSAFVRDYYFFKRSQYPQLELVHMKPEDAFYALQKQELLHKFVEIGKVLLTWAILKNVDMVVQRVVFLHEELMKLPSFPRKALQSDLDLYKGGELGKQLLGLDVLHKFMWVRLIARMFEAMAGNFAYSGDIHLFLNVLNGALILHSEDACILRYVMATYINAAFHFKNIFSTNGYLLIMPTLLKIYSNHQTNRLVTTTIEYAVKQFYLMNRKPFILQMFGSVSAMLDTDEAGTYGDAHKIQSSCLFNLLLSLETPSPDPLNIAELVKEDKPLKAIDFCYHDENEMVTILDCISLCVMVVSYSSESTRGYQMLIILEAILPCYVKHIQLPTYNKEGKTEKEIINQLAIAIRTLINNCESLTKTYNGPYRSSPEHKGSSQRNYHKSASPAYDAEKDSDTRKTFPEHTRTNPIYDHDIEDSDLRTDYRRPRDVLLSLVGEFIWRASERLNELNKKNNQDGKVVELLDTRSHIRLADIAHGLLKISPYDPESMACRGMQFYMNYILPSTEWADDAMRPALVTILRRLDKVFQKISKKPSIRRNTDWDAAAGLLKGIYDTIMKYPYVLHWQHVKVLINTCQALIVNDCFTTEGCSAATAALLNQPPPPNFCSTVVRLIAAQILNPEDYYTLEQVCGGSSTFPSQDKTENIIMNLITPLCLRVGSGRKDVGHMRPNDISFALTLVLHAMSPPNTKSALSSGPNLKVTSEIRTGSLTFTGTRDTKATAKVNTSLYQVAFLALKVMTICFEGELVTDWFRIARTMRELSKRNEATTFLWDFLDFIVTHRTPLYILMQPFIFQRLAQPPISDFERTMHAKIRDKIRGIGLPQPRCRGALLMELATAMKDLKDELEDISEESSETMKKSEQPDKPTVHMTSEIPHRHQRPSLIDFLTGGDLGLKHTQKSASEQQIPQPQPKGSTSSASYGSTPNQANVSGGESQEKNVSGSNVSCKAAADRTRHSSVSGELPPKSESFSHHKAHKLRFVSSVEFRHSSGETSTTPLSPGSPDDSSGDVPNKSRLQRIKPQSRKTFRLRKSRKTLRTELSQPEYTTDFPTPQPTSPPSAPPPPQPEPQTVPQSPQQPPDPHRLRISTARVKQDGSYDEDSMVSQTSSISGYRESYPVMQLKETLDSSPKAFPPLASPDLPSTSYTQQDNSNSSPDASFNGENTALLSPTDRTLSQQSLMMVFEQQDETTLI